MSGGATPQLCRVMEKADLPAARPQLTYLLTPELGICLRAKATRVRLYFASRLVFVCNVPPSPCRPLEYVSSAVVSCVCVLSEVS